VLNNCAGIVAIPPAISYISAAATVVSYATTGKGTSDHLISAIVEQDCALHRVLFEAEICFEKHQTIALAHAPARQTE
jgi:hypothetical protein